MADDRVYIAGGHVYCRIARSDMDIEQCMGCARLRQLEDKASPPYIVCRTERVPESLMNDAEFREWWHSHHRPGR